MEKTKELNEHRFISQDLGEEIVIYEPQAALVHFLNETASEIFRTMQVGITSPEEITLNMISKYSGDYKAIKHAVEKIKYDFNELGIFN